MNLIECFDVRPDERHSFELASSEFKTDLGLHAEPLSMDTIDLIPVAVEAISVLGKSHLDEILLGKLAERGIKFVATRSIGYDNVDVSAATKFGIRVSNATYAPDGVAEFTVMMMLIALRKVKQINARSAIQDYALVGSCGRELGSSRVGIIGTGRIGAKVAQLVKGFGGEIVGYDVYQNPELSEILTYVSLEELLETCDVITLHAPLLDSNVHMLDEAAFNRMKEGVTIVNCSRGELIDTNALIAAIESGKVRALSADVIEHDLEYFHQDLRHDVIHNHQLAILRSFPNVFLTPHVAFYTDRVVKDMVYAAVGSLVSFLEKGISPLEVTSG
ncbi:MAG: NAD(P)-dependent oxidoreductase [Propionibacteriaceae bacterium]